MTIGLLETGWPLGTQGLRLLVAKHSVALETRLHWTLGRIGHLVDGHPVAFTWPSDQQTIQMSDNPNNWRILSLSHPAKNLKSEIIKLNEEPRILTIALKN